MILGLSIAVGVLFISSVVLAALFFSTKLKKAHLQGEIARFKGITDAEQHLREQKSKADAAIAELARATSELQELASRTSAQRELLAAGEQQLAAKRSEISLAEQLLGAFKTLDEVTGQIEKQK